MRSEKPVTNLNSGVPLMGKPYQVAIGQKHIRYAVAAELHIKALLLKQGFIVSDPVVDSGYDFITDWEGIINRVQVRSTSVPQKRSAIRTRYRIKCHSKGNWTVLAAYIQPTAALYFIPWDMCMSVNMDFPLKATSKSRYGKYKEAWELLKETH